MSHDAEPDRSGVSPPTPPPPMTLSEARFAVLETLQHGDWQAMPLDGNGARILIADCSSADGSSTYWIVTVEPATITRDAPDA